MLPPNLNLVLLLPVMGSYAIFTIQVVPIGNPTLQLLRTFLGFLDLVKLHQDSSTLGEEFGLVMACSCARFGFKAILVFAVPELDKVLCRRGYAALRLSGVILAIGLRATLVA
jgi:hypothetical protein